MALNSFFFTMSLLLFSFVLLASASDYGNTKSYDDESKSKNYNFNFKVDIEKSKSDDKSKQEGSGNDDYSMQHVSKPKSEDKPEPETQDYGYKPDGSKSKPKDRDYNTKPKSKDNPENHDYGYKPDTSKQKQEDQGYSPKQDHGYEKPLPICIEGLVLCKSGLKYYPIPGAVAKITCRADDKYGSKTTSFSISSKKTDSKGYFLADLSSLKLADNLKLKECKAFLDNSPLKDCKIPTDVNKGITGALLHSYRVLEDKKIKLYWVGPFFFTSESKSIPVGY